MAQRYSRGDYVTWKYRSGRGHGTVSSIARKDDDNADNVLYNVRQVDHHEGEPDLVQHTGKALSPSTKGAVDAARKRARERDRK